MWRDASRASEWGVQLDTLRVKLRDGHPAFDCYGLAKSLDSLKFVHGLGCEIRLPTVGTRPHGNTFNDQQ